MSYNLVLVNYINTLPFLEALTNSNSNFEINEKIPKLCGIDFMNGHADIALIPCGFLPQMKELPFKVLDKFGIACDGAVRTVKLLSHAPVQDIKTISLDNHSTSSSKLLKILCELYWKIQPIFTNKQIAHDTNEEAVLMIGDKVFEHESNYEYAYDLGEIWKQFTGLPFVFAVWVAKQDMPQKIIDELYEKLEKGIIEIEHTIEKYKPIYPNIDIESYLGTHIKYKLDERYQEGLEKYLDLLKLKVT